MSIPSITETVLGGSGILLSSGTPVSDFFILKLTGVLVGPSAAQFKKHGTFFQMTAELYADLEVLDPRVGIDYSEQWSLGDTPKAVQAVKVTKTGAVEWSDTDLEDTGIGRPSFFDALEKGRVTAVAKFSAGSGRVSSLWGRYAWPEMTINLPAIHPFPQESLRIDKSQIVADIPTHKLEWKYRPLKIPEP